MKLQSLKVTESPGCASAKWCPVLFDVEDGGGAATNVAEAHAAGAANRTFFTGPR